MACQFHGNLHACSSACHVHAMLAPWYGMTRHDLTGHGKACHIQTCTSPWHGMALHNRACHAIFNYAPPHATAWHGSACHGSACHDAMCALRVAAAQCRAPVTPCPLSRHGVTSCQLRNSAASCCPCYAIPTMPCSMLAAMSMQHAALTSLCATCTLPAPFVRRSEPTLCPGGQPHRLLPAALHRPG